MVAQRGLNPSSRKVGHIFIMKQGTRYSWSVLTLSVLVLSQSTTRAQGWALDTSSYTTNLYASPTSSSQNQSSSGGTTNKTNNVASTFGSGSDYVCAYIHCWGDAGTQIYNLTGSFSAYGYGEARAYAYWRWYGPPGASTPVTCHIYGNIDGNVSIDGSAGVGSGGTASTLSYATGSSYAYASANGGYGTVSGYAQAYGSASAGTQGNWSLTGPGATFYTNSSYSSYEHYSVDANYNVFVEAWYTAPAGTSSILAFTQGSADAHSETDAANPPPGGTPAQAGSNAHATADGYSVATLSW